MRVGGGTAAGAGLAAVEGMRVGGASTPGFLALAGAGVGLAGWLAMLAQDIFFGAAEDEAEEFPTEEDTADRPTNPLLDALSLTDAESFMPSRPCWASPRPPRPPSGRPPWFRGGSSMYDE